MEIEALLRHRDQVVRLLHVGVGDRLVGDDDVNVMALRFGGRTGANVPFGQEFIREKDGRRTSVYVRLDGSVQLDEDGKIREFTDLAHLKREAPEVVKALRVALKAITGQAQASPDALEAWMKSQGMRID